jgi:hypothetical protein
MAWLVWLNLIILLEPPTDAFAGPARNGLILGHRGSPGQGLG